VEDWAAKAHANRAYTDKQLINFFARGLDMELMTTFPALGCFNSIIYLTFIQ
jgi:hypothetical protein